MSRQQGFALSILGALLLPAAASAQVTVFGVMDLAARNVSNGGVGSITSQISGGNSTSRFGVRGTEDLGGGLSAGFHIESSIGADTGSGGATAPAGQFWDRRSTLSLTSASVGELRLGRDFTPAAIVWLRLDAMGYNGVASSGNLIANGQTGPIKSSFGSNPNVLLRASNGVQYLLPSGIVNGLELGLMLAPGEAGTAAATQHKIASARVNYSVGAFSIGAGTLTAQNDITGAEKFKDNVIGGSYDFGVAKAMLAWRQFKLLNAKQTNLLIGATAPVGAGEVRVSYQRANLDGAVGATDISNNDATQLGLGYLYNLSKRTAAYATYSHVGNNGSATFAVPGGPSGMAGGQSSTGYEFGLRHNF